MRQQCFRQTKKYKKMAIGLRGWKSRLVDIFDRPTFGRGE